MPDQYAAPACPNCAATAAKAIRIFKAQRDKSNTYTLELWAMIEEMRDALLAVPASPCTGPWWAAHGGLVASLRDVVSHGH